MHARLLISDKMWRQDLAEDLWLSVARHLATSLSRTHLESPGTKGLAAFATQHTARTVNIRMMAREAILPAARTGAVVLR
jgi:hypothetical protein